MKRIRETSRESYYLIPSSAREIEVLRVLSDGKERTAMQCSRALNKAERNYTQPRLTALCYGGFVRVCGKAWDYETERTVSLYRITVVGLCWLKTLEGGGCSKTGT